MGLQQFERRLERLVEGVFAKAFRSGLQPVEIGRRLTREMDLRRQVAPKGVLAPNRFVVSLSPQDWARFEPIEEELVAELVSVAKDHAHTEDYGFVGGLDVRLETDDDLSPGMLLVAGEMARSQPDRSQPARSQPDRNQPDRSQPDRSAPRPAGTSPPPAGAAPAAAPQGGRERTFRRDEPAGGNDDANGSAAGFDVAPPRAQPGRARARDDATLVLPDGRRLVVGTKGLVMGRLPGCDLVLADPNVSRRHAEVRPSGDGRFEVTDLGSTNGTKVNGTKVRGVRVLQDGDGLTVGATTLRFEQG